MREILCTAICEGRKIQRFNFWLPDCAYALLVANSEREARQRHQGRVTPKSNTVPTIERPHCSLSERHARAGQPCDRPQLPVIHFTHTAPPRQKTADLS